MLAQNPTIKCIGRKWKVWVNTTSPSEMRPVSRLGGQNVPFAGPGWSIATYASIAHFNVALAKNACQFPERIILGFVGCVLFWRFLSVGFSVLEA